MKQNTRIGTYIKCTTTSEPFKAYLPPPLPPNPALEFSLELNELIEKANIALGRLDGFTMLLPDPSLFKYLFIRKEALLSSQIEGTQSSIADLMLHESHEQPGVPIDDVEEVSSYIKAMNYGLARIRADFPMSLRLIREIHNKLLAELSKIKSATSIQ